MPKFWKLGNNSKPSSSSDPNRDADHALLTRTSFHNLSGHGNDGSNRLSEREASSAWYRYGVPVTDVYDVVEVLGQGHMGEVFTVRRKTTGHHTEITRERTKESEDDLRSMMNKDGDEDGKIFDRARRETRKKKSKNDKGGGGGHRRNSSLGSLGKKVRKSMRRRKDRDADRLDEDADSNLAAFIKDDYYDDAADGRSLREPPRLTGPDPPATPPKGVLKGGRFSSQNNNGSRPSTAGSTMTAQSAATSTSGGETTRSRCDSSRLSDVSGMLSVESADSLGGTASLGNLSLQSPGNNSTLTANRTSFATLDGIEVRGKRGVHFQRTFAVKTILTSRINKDQMQELVNEIMIMRKLDHPYVLKLYEVYHVKRKLWLVTELLTGGDLSSRKLNEHDAKNVIEQVLRALVYLHRMGIVHRDIKLENVMYENHSKGSTVRLIDFGLSRTFDRTSIVGDFGRTPYTMSPEAAGGGGGTDGEFMTDKTDVWAVGVITFIMLSGEFPFIKTNADLKDPEKMNRLKKASYHFGITWKGRGITPNAREFVKGCLHVDPNERWTAKQALEHLQKTWAPDVDRIWDAWLAEVKKNKKPEFVQPQDLPKDDVDDDTGSQCSSSSWLDETNNDDVPPPSFDNEARAKYIKTHVEKVVRAKKAEGPIDDCMKESVKLNIEEMEQYTKFGFMKKTILITMANTMERGDVGKLRELFLKADTEDTGTITLRELIASFRRVSPEVDVKRVEDIFYGIDRDSSGHIHYAEFLAALAESHGLVTLDRLTEAFDRIDTDGKGYITHDDLKSILGKDYDKETVDKMIEEGDFKKNNKIDYEELLHLMFSDPVKGDELAGSVISPSSSYTFD